MSEKQPTDDAVINELVCIKKLMILQMLNNGFSQAQVASALGVAQSSISRMFPNGIGSKSKPTRN